MNVQFTDNSEAVKSQMGKNIGKALESIGLHAINRSTELTPVKTGRLRASIKHKIDMDAQETTIGTAVEYAIYVHEGTRRMVARPFIRDGIQNYKAEYEEIISKTLKEGFQ